MYDADDEMNRLYEFMREEAQEQDNDHYDTETIAIASTLHKENY